MRLTPTWVRTVCVAGLVAGIAVAQPPRGDRGGQPGRGGFGMGQQGRVGLVMNKGVQEEIKVTDEQKTKIREYVESTQKEQGEKMRDLAQSGDREKIQEMMKEITAAADKFVKDTLDAKQNKRLTQIHWQDSGLAAFNDDEVQKALTITAEQKEKFKAMGEELAKDMGELRRGMRDDPQGTQTKIAAIRKESMTKAQEVLTADQKKEWKELVGAPFEVKREQGAFGRRKDKDKDK